MNVAFHLPNSPTATPGLASPYRGGSRPIAFPPTDVWYVLVKSDDEPAQVVFVAMHQDWYFSEWLIHTPPGDQSAAELATQLASIGCGLKSDH